jgi:hypothetical protein
MILERDLKSCQNKPLSDSTIVYLPSDSIPVEIPVKIPVPYKVEVPDTIPTVIDTMAILKKYFAVNFYDDIIADSMLEVRIKEQITQNNIAEREFEYKILKQKQITITNTIIKSNTGLFLGANIGRAKNEFGFGPSISYITKKPILLGINYDLLNKDVYLTFQWRLFGKH